MSEAHLTLYPEPTMSVFISRLRIDLRKNNTNKMEKLC